MQTIPWHLVDLVIELVRSQKEPMMFRRKLLAVFALTVFLSVAAVAWLVSAVTRRAFDRSEDERTAALVTQFRREFNRQGEDVARHVEAIAASEPAKPHGVGVESQHQRIRDLILSWRKRRRRIVSSTFWSL